MAQVRKFAIGGTFDYDGLVYQMDDALYQQILEQTQEDSMTNGKIKKMVADVKSNKDHTLKYDSEKNRLSVLDASGNTLYDFHEDWGSRGKFKAFLGEQVQSKKNNANRDLYSVFNHLTLKNEEPIIETTEPDIIGNDTITVPIEVLLDSKGKTVKENGKDKYRVVSTDYNTIAALNRLNTIANYLQDTDWSKTHKFKSEDWTTYLNNSEIQKLFTDTEGNPNYDYLTQLKDAILNNNLTAEQRSFLKAFNILVNTPNTGTATTTSTTPSSVSSDLVLPTATSNGNGSGNGSNGSDGTSIKTVDDVTTVQGITNPFNFASRYIIEAPGLNELAYNAQLTNENWDEVNRFNTDTGNEVFVFSQKGKKPVYAVRNQNGWLNETHPFATEYLNDWGVMGTESQPITFGNIADIKRFTEDGARELLPTSGLTYSNGMAQPGSYKVYQRYGNNNEYWIEFFVNDETGGKTTRYVQVDAPTLATLQTINDKTMLDKMLESLSNVVNNGRVSYIPKIYKSGGILRLQGGNALPVADSTKVSEQQQYLQSLIDTYNTAEKSDATATTTSTNNSASDVKRTSKTKIETPWTDKLRMTAMGADAGIMGASLIAPVIGDVAQVITNLVTTAAFTVADIVDAANNRMTTGQVLGNAGLNTLFTLATLFPYLGDAAALAKDAKMAKLVKNFGNTSKDILKTIEKGGEISADMASDWATEARALKEINATKFETVAKDIDWSELAKNLTAEDLQKISNGMEFSKVLANGRKAKTIEVGRNIAAGTRAAGTTLGLGIAGSAAVDVAKDAIMGNWTTSDWTESLYILNTALAASKRAAITKSQNQVTKNARIAELAQQNEGVSQMELAKAVSKSDKARVTESVFGIPANATSSNIETAKDVTDYTKSKIWFDRAQPKERRTVVRASANKVGENLAGNKSFRRRANNPFYGSTVQTFLWPTSAETEETQETPQIMYAEPSVARDTVYYTLPPKVPIISEKNGGTIQKMAGGNKLSWNDLSQAYNGYMGSKLPTDNYTTALKQAIADQARQRRLANDFTLSEDATYDTLLTDTNILYDGIEENKRDAWIEALRQNKTFADTGFDSELESSYNTAKQNYSTGVKAYGTKFGNAFTQDDIDFINTKADKKYADFDFQSYLNALNNSRKNFNPENDKQWNRAYKRYSKSHLGSFGDRDILESHNPTFNIRTGNLGQALGHGKANYLQKLRGNAEMSRLAHQVIRAEEAAPRINMATLEALKAELEKTRNFASSRLISADHFANVAQRNQANADYINRLFDLNKQETTMYNQGLAQQQQINSTNNDIRYKNLANQINAEIQRVGADSKAKEEFLYGRSQALNEYLNNFITDDASDRASRLSLDLQRYTYLSEQQAKHPASMTAADRAELERLYKKIQGQQSRDLNHWWWD